jgi:hypothetical protein
MFRAVFLGCNSEKSNYLIKKPSLRNTVTEKVVRCRYRHTLVPYVGADMSYFMALG